MTKEEYIYQIWAVLAVMGHMRQADQLLRQHKREIHAVASKLQRSLSNNIPMLYRGLLLDTTGVSDEGTLTEEYPVEFLSFTENTEVAALFASPDSFMSAYVVGQKPNVKGYIISHKPKKADVLFHYKWHDQLKIRQNFPQIALNLAANGLNIVFDQYLHNIATQQEWILKPVTTPFNLIPKEQISDLSGPELDKKYLGPYINKISMFEIDPDDED